MPVSGKAQSIRQIPRYDALPDFRNLGVITRILLTANAAALLAAMLRSQSAAGIFDQFARAAIWVEPSLLACLVVLYLGSRVLARLPYGIGVASVIVIAAAITMAMQTVTRALGRFESADPLWGTSYAALLAGVLAIYFHLRNRAFSPALAEAQLQALQARIRPHFLFNSLNAVLSLVRHDTRRAEAALEDLAELFRNLMADTRDLVPLRDELALCRQYLELEHLRLGERLRVEWRVAEGVDAALVPPMMLQPLVENAVYHGIEPGVQPGRIEIGIERSGERLKIRLTNPYYPEHQHRQGNRMALDNVRERLRLHFDVEATLKTGTAGERYQIEMVIPYRTS